MPKVLSVFHRPGILARLAEAATDIAAGDRYRKVPGLDRNDSCGTLARALDKVRRSLQDADGAVAERDAEGDHQEQRRTSMETFVAKFEHSVEEVQQSLTAAAEGMRGAAAALAEQTATVSSRSREVEQSAATASRDSATLAGATSQLDASLGELEARVTKAVALISGTVAMVDGANTTILGLSAAADRIGGMAHVISDIAGQTRMLALNATIEAARAGEAGRGFAVVAAEVKNLVGETEKATADIDAHARDIALAAADTVTAMGSIAQSMHQVNDLMAAVAAATHQQSAASRTLSEGIRSTAAEATMMSASIHEVATATEQTRCEATAVDGAAAGLATQSEALRTAVTTFLDDLDHGAIRIGILHSLSGGSAVGERPLKDVLMLEVAALNRRGGLLGRPVEALIYNPRSEADRYAEAAERALAQDHVAALFGGWSSTSRKAVLPVLARHHGLLFYPSQYEGGERDPHVVYCGAPPNQQLVPAVRYLMSAAGGGFRRFFLVGNDTLYPRQTNRVLTDFLGRQGVPRSHIRERLLPVGAEDWEKTVAEIRAFARDSGGPALVVSTVGGASNFYFFRQLGGANVPVLTLSIGEAEAALMDPALLAGHMVAWSYLMAVETPENRTFVADWRAHCGRADAVVNDAMEASVLAFRLWTKAVEAAGGTQAQAVLQQLPNQRVRSLTGLDLFVDPANNHLHKPAMVGRLGADGGIRILWQSEGVIAPEVEGDPVVQALAAE
jgi:urea transport system substrate-binding protein